MIVRGEVASSTAQILTKTDHMVFNGAQGCLLGESDGKAMRDVLGEVPVN